MVFFLILLCQHVASLGPSPDKSNLGHTKLKLRERLLLFLFRIRRKTTFKELGYFFGVGKATAHKYFVSMLKMFNEVISPVLLKVPSQEELLRNRPPAAAVAFPNAFLIYDGTNFPLLKPENFAFNRMTYSAYKGFNSLQVVVGEWNHTLL